MKKTLALLLALAMILGAAACGKTQDPTVPATSGNEAATTRQAVPEPTKQTEPGTSKSTEAPTTAEEPTPAGPAIEVLNIGTTAAIEKAVNSEYAYDMLSSGTTQLPLVWQDTEGNFHPLLASFDTKDGQTWTYTVEEGMCWDDGVPVTAEDILFTLQYEDENGSANLKDQTDSEGKTTRAKYSAAAVSADGRSISLTLAEPNIRELGNMTSFRTLPKHVYEGKASLSDDEMRMGCGPYKFESFSKDSGTISFTVNPYYPAVPNVGKLVYRLFDNEDTMYMALQQGDIDMVWIYSTGVGASYQEVLAGSDSVQLISVNATNAPAVLAFNNARGPFADENLRHAVALALDYETFRTYVGSAAADIPNAGFVPTSTLGYKDTPQLKTDLTAAEDYMKKAGYTRNADGKFVNDKGEAFGFTLTYRSDRPNQVSCAELIKTQIEKFGGQVTLDALDSASYNAKTSNKFSENNITMEAALFGYTSAGMGMGSGLGTIYVDGTHAVQGGCQVYDETFQGILKEMSDAKVLQDYLQAAGKVQDYYAGHAPLVALYWDCLTYGISSRFENITVDTAFGLNNVNNWFSITEK